MSRPFCVVTAKGKSVRMDVLDGYAVKEASRQLTDQSAFESRGGDQLLRPRYDPTTLGGLLELSTPNYVACRQKAIDTAGLGWRWDRVRDGADEAERDRLAAFFDELPAPASALRDDDLQNVFEAAALDFESTGRGVVEVVREGHRHDAPPRTILHVPAHTIRIHRDGQRFVQMKHGKKRWFKWIGAPIDVDYRTGETAPAGELAANRRATEILWWRNYHILDPVYGVPDVIPALGAVQGDLGRVGWNLEFFENFGVPAYAVFVTGDFDPGPVVDKDGKPAGEDHPDGKTELEWQIEQHFAEMREHPHSTLVLTLPTRSGEQEGKVEVTFEKLSTEVKEASFRLYRKDNREEVLSAHRMSAAIAGVFDAGAANREAINGYKRSVVRPRQRKMERLVTRHVVAGGFGVIDWRWRLVQIDSRDVKRELEMWLILLNVGAATLREFVENFAEPFGLPLPPADDARFDRRVWPGQGGQDGGVEDVLRAMRDDLVMLAAKSNGEATPLLTAAGRIGR